MIEGLFSEFIYYIQTVLQIILPLLPWLAGAAMLTAWLERFHLERLQPSQPLNGALLGLLSPLPTIAAIPLLRSESKGTAAFLIASLLLNPILFFLITANLGWESAVIYLLLVLLISFCFGVVVRSKAVSPKATTIFAAEPWMRRAWKHLSFIGFYTLMGALIAALMRNNLSWTLYNLKKAGNIPLYIRPFLITASIPIYLCGGAWLPVLDELNGLGLTPGFALAFILLGQATRPAHLLALQTMLSRKALAGFLAITGLLSLAMIIYF